MKTRSLFLLDFDKKEYFVYDFCGGIKMKRGTKQTWVYPRAFHGRLLKDLNFLSLVGANNIRRVRDKMILSFPADKESLVIEKLGEPERRI